MDWIVQYDPPDEPNEYIHRVGRIARGEGGKGNALLFLIPEELQFLRYLKGDQNSPGWFPKDPNILGRVGHILLQAPFVMQRSPRQIVIADDCFQHINVPLDRSSQVVVKATEKLFGRQVLKHINLGDYLSSRVPSLKGCSGQKPNDKVKASSLKLLAYIMQFLQSNFAFDLTTA
ncbi:hypothetical protein JHK82_021869 [Glycine max]|nr:hypothetical protein JHK86_021887 [Glycine max]KAG5137138.1 hypothetical protein JHK82_021869 [Glycine max]